jgi:hypothetical protein
MYKRNSPEANYKTSTSKEEKSNNKTHTNKIKNKAIYIIIQFNSILIYLCADLTAQGQLQSQHR